VRKHRNRCAVIISSRVWLPICVSPLPRAIICSKMMWWPEFRNSLLLTTCMVIVSKSHENGNSRMTPRVPEILTGDDFPFLQLDVLIADWDFMLWEKIRSLLKSKLNPDKEQVTEYHHVGPVDLWLSRTWESLRVKSGVAVSCHHQDVSSQVLFSL
jgi:hypothetical protein